jgi:hypothetical protein
MSKETTSQITCPGPGRQNSPAERGQFSHGADTPDVPGPPGSPRMSLHDMQATSATTLTPSHLRTADVHPRNTSGLDREGIARALQLAASATADVRRQHDAEEVLAACLSDRQVARLGSPGLCHGIAGLYQTAARAAADALTPAISSRLPGLVAALADRGTWPARPGLLTGSTGARLALETARDDAVPRSGWDSCLLLT